MLSVHGQREIKKPHKFHRVSKNSYLIWSKVQSVLRASPGYSPSVRIRACSRHDKRPLRL